MGTGHRAVLDGSAFLLARSPQLGTNQPEVCAEGSQPCRATHHLPCCPSSSKLSPLQELHALAAFKQGDWLTEMDLVPALLYLRPGKMTGYCKGLCPYFCDLVDW